VGEFYVCLSVWLTAAQASGLFVMEDGVITGPDHGVAWIGLWEGATNNDVTRLNFSSRYLMKAVGR